MVTGVSDGFSRTLEIVGVGYRAEAMGSSQIKFNLGYSNPVEFSIPEGISAEFEERGTRLILKGIDKQVLGQTAARIRELRPPDSYKGKGVRYSTEKLKLKPGKAGAKGKLEFEQFLKALEMIAPRVYPKQPAEIALQNMLENNIINLDKYY